MNRSQTWLVWLYRAACCTALLWIPQSLAAAPPPGAATTSPAWQDAVALLDVWVGEQVAYQEIPGLVIGVVRGEQLVWAKGYGHANLADGSPMTPQTLFRIGSLTKMFTATALLQLRDAGKLRLDDPLAKHLPWFTVQSEYRQGGPIRVAHLLTHTSGLPREAAFPYWTTHVFPSRDELRTALPLQRVVAPPGERLKYSNLGLALAGEVVAAVAGSTWHDYVERQIFAPLGMQSSATAPDDAEQNALARAYWRKRPARPREEATYYDTGALAPAAAIVSNLEDLARFAAFHLGAPNLDAVLSTATRREMQRPQALDPSWVSGRGWGFLLSRRNDRTLVSHGGWIGGHRTDLLLDPARQLGIVVLANADDANPALFSRKALDQLGPLCDPPSAKVAKTPDPAWQRLLGRYTDPWGWEYQVLILDGGLVLYEHNYPPAEDPDDGLTRLESRGGLRFRMADGEDLEFELDASGQVARIRRRYEYLLPLREPDAESLWLKEENRP